MGFGKGLLSLGACFVVVSACGGTSDSSTFTVVTPQTIQAIATTICGRQAACLGTNIFKALYGNADTCTARQVAQFDLDVKSQGYGVSDSGAQACNAALVNVACADLLVSNVPPACQFTGTLANGATCTADADCASGACYIDDAASCGKCGDRAALGADCTNAECARGLKCSSTKKCTNGAIGQACTADGDCLFNSYCRNSVCTAPLEAGAQCVVNPSGADVPCNILGSSVGCIPAKLTDKTSTCQAVTIGFAQSGGTCGLATTGGTVTVTACDSSDCTNGVCAARIADGANCTVGGPACQQPATCRNGVCALKDPNVCVGK